MDEDVVFAVKMEFEDAWVMEVSEDGAVGIEAWVYWCSCMEASKDVIIPVYFLDLLLECMLMISVIWC